ncbi:MAG: hypothetical protein ACK5Y2_05735 [Bdellovibrionales bacterium]
MKTSVLTAVTTTLLAANLAGAAPWIKSEGSINFDVTGKKSADYERDLRIQDAELRFEIFLREGVKAVVKAELERKLNSDTRKEDLNWEQLLEEAYIEVQTDKMGLPQATVIFGKHSIAFGQKVTEIPMFKDALLYSLNRQDEVVGLTVALPANYLKIVDSVAISLFEAGAGDFKISDEKGYSIKLGKALTKQLQAQVSAMMKENAQTSKSESRVSVGLVFTDAAGKMKVWAEGLIINNHPLYGNTQGLTVGGSYKVGPGSVVLELSNLQDVAREAVVAYNMPVTRFMVLSPEVRLRENQDGSDETTVGIRARLQHQAELKTKLRKG